MSLYHPIHCDSLPLHYTDACREPEYGRLRSAGFIHQDFSFTDPASSVEWQAGITSGAIILIPETNGDSPKASPRTAPAYGRTPESVQGYDFTAHYSDPDYQLNCAFYNKIIGNLNYRFFFRTSSQVYITDVPVSIIPNRDIKNDLTSEIVWEVDIKWISKKFPCGTMIPDGIFEPVPHSPTYGYSTTHTDGHGIGGGTG